MRVRGCPKRAHRINPPSLIFTLSIGLEQTDRGDPCAVFTTLGGAVDVSYLGIPGAQRTLPDTAGSL